MLRIDSSLQSLTTYKNRIQSPNYVVQARFCANKLIPPLSSIYHAAFPDFCGTEDHVSEQRIRMFESLVGQHIAWAYFSNNWSKQIKFPASGVQCRRLCRPEDSRLSA
ncbi:MAG: hypothetical protein K0U68_12975 [Gammaproteobacteria bacterium]|nr:hypothetical protein [Gammaproteobacteria bacterium]